MHAGDVVLTRLEANRHRVMRSSSLVRGIEVGYLKIVAPCDGCAGVEQKGREAWVTPDQWSIYDTTDTYAVANPVRVEHLIVMVPKAAPRRARPGARPADGAPPRRQRRRRAAGAGDDAQRVPRAARHDATPRRSGVGDAITQFVHLSMLDLAGLGTALTQREALRERIKQHVAHTSPTPSCRSTRSRVALNCSRRQLYNAFAEEPDGVAGYSCARRLEACRQAFDDRQPATARSPTSRWRSASRTWRTSAACSAPTSAWRRATTAGRGAG